ncbi:MAG: T9SS type A sorting domain-containing protein [Bacteroidota bacterium]
MIKKNIILFAITLFTGGLSHAQSVLTWQQVNTDKQEIPWSVERLNDGSVLLAAVRYATYTSKHNLLMIKLDANGNPIKQNEIAFKDTSVQTTGGVFLYNDTEIVVFCTIDLDTPYANPLKWGVIKLDTAFNYKNMQLYDVPVILNNNILVYPWFADYMKIKKDNQGDFYGDLVIRKKAPLNLFYEESELSVARYNSWIWMNNNLQLQNQRNDTIWLSSPNHKDTFRLDMRTGGGDIVKANDSIYITLQPDGGGGLIYTQYAAINNQLKFREGYGLRFPDTWQTPDGLSTFHSFIQLTKWYNNKILITSPVDHHFWNQTKDTINHNLGQGVIEVHDIQKTEQDTLHVFQFTFTEPLVDSTYQSNYQSYNPAPIKSLDFIDRNIIYYTRATADVGFNSTVFHNSRMFISQFDSSLNLKWTKMIGELSDTDMDVVPYNILAIADGGCMAFARKKMRYFNDSYFPQYKVPEYDIVVYKLNSLGSFTNVRELNSNNTQNSVSVYPNPANDKIIIELLNSQKATVEIINVTGQIIYTQKLNNKENTIPTDQLSNGIYFLKIIGENNFYSTRKIIVNH